MIKSMLDFTTGNGSGDGSSYGAGALEIIIASAMKLFDAARNR